MSEKTQSSNDQLQQTSETRRFASDLIWVAAVQIINSLVMGIITFPFLTKSYSSEVFGIWNQVNLSVGVLSIALTLQLGLSAVRFLSGEEDKLKRRRALGSMLFVIVIVACLALIAANFATSQISVLLFASPDYVLFVRLTFLWMVTASITYFLTSYLRARRRIKLLSTQQLLSSLITMALIIILSTSGFKLEWIIISIIIVQLVFLVIFAALIISEVGVPTPNLSGLKGYFAFCVPQIPGSILLWMINFSDRYFITHFLGLSQAGIYGPSFNLAFLTSLFYTPIGFVLFPSVAKFWEEKRFEDARNYIEYCIKLFLTMAVPSAVGLAIISQALLKFLTTSEFLAGRELVLLISVGVIFQGIYYINVNAVYLLKKTRILPPMIIASAVTSVLLNLILIPHLGLLGAAVSNIAAYSVLATIMTLWARKAMRIRIDYGYISKIVGAALIMAICLYFIHIQGLLSIILAIFAGASIYGVSLYLLRAFSDQDKRILKSIINGLIPARATSKR
jgi:O-antigen/teichoic acid export membrane protein